MIEVNCDFVELIRDQWYFVIGDWEVSPEKCVVGGPYTDYNDAVDASKNHLPPQGFSWRIFDLHDGFDEMGFDDEPNLKLVLSRASSRT